MQQARAAAMVLPVLLLAAATVPRADDIDDYVKAQLQAFKLPGLSLAVVKDGKAVKVAGYGLADVERGTPSAPQTVYKIGSVSKQFIAAGIMLLVQQERMSVDDPVSKHLDGTPPAWAPITVRHLLTHTAGLGRESPAFDPSTVKSDAEVIKAAYPLPLQFQPGTRWQYSNVGYFALAEIISTVARQPWTAFLGEHAFKPAGLSVTAPTNVKPTLANRARGYTGNDNQRVADDWVALRPSGAFFSTVQDLARWDAVLDTDRVLTEQTRRQMWTPVQLNGGTTHPYGFGWHVETVDGRRVVRHGGGMPGFTAHYLRFVDDRLTVIVLANGDDVDLPNLTAGIAARYLVTGGAKPQAPAGRGQTPPGPPPTHADLDYAPPDPPTSNGHKLDLYVPTGSTTPLPVVIWTGGSAWRADTGKRLAGGLAAQVNPAGYAVAGVSIRSSSQVKFPGQLHDIKAAIRWLRANAAKYDLDPARIAIMGDSSGGWTTAMAAVTGDAPELEGSVGVTTVPSTVQAAVAFYPPTDFLSMDFWALRKCVQPNCHDNESSPESQLVGCAIQSCPDKARAADPSRYVTAADPPLMILHGGSDPLVPHNQGELLYMALNKACRDAVFIGLPRAGHGPWNGFLTNDAFREAATMRSTSANGCKVTNPVPHTPTWQTVIQFLDKYMKRPR